MRNSLAIVVTSVFCLLATAASSSAEVIYPWCAQYGTRGGARNCGFNTWEQCRAAISGNGGYCIENPFWQWRRDPAARYRSRRAPGWSELAPAERTLAARNYPSPGWCGLKGRRGDPRLFLSQQASGCFD